MTLECLTIFVLDPWEKLCKPSNPGEYPKMSSTLNSSNNQITVKHRITDTILLTVRMWQTDIEAKSDKLQGQVLRERFETVFLNILFCRISATNFLTFNMDTVYLLPHTCLPTWLNICLRNSQWPIESFSQIFCSLWIIL